MADKEYTFHYFPLYARGECIRFLLTHAGVNFEDHEVQFSEWPAIKPTMPGGVMPCLELKDGTRMGQTLAILRFLGHTYGYYPENHDTAWQCDALCDGMADIFGKLNAPNFAKGEAKEVMINELFDKILPKFLAICEAKLADGRTYLCGDQLTIADFYIGGVYTNNMTNENIPFAKERWGSCLDNFPNFKAYGDRFVAEN